jgi:UDP-N-acetylglucosamine 2-epimerase (non-hydrolysing)
MRIKILSIVGTRPEIIKVAPVVMALNKCSWVESRLISTGQHSELLNQHLHIFGLKQDHELEAIKPGQSLTVMTSQLAERLERVLLYERPDLVLSQGDTTTVMVTSMVCFYLGIKFAHLEAGLRSGNLFRPFPEEYNRKVVTLSAALHISPTERAKQSLLVEGVPEKSIVVTGNTVIDSLYYILDRLPYCSYPINSNLKLILLTAHRRENLGAPLQGIFKMFFKLVSKRDDIELLYPVHPNPNVVDMAQKILTGHERIHLIRPLDYQDFIAALKKSYIVVSDSGGVQEEAPALGKPVLVLRDVTERVETVELGMAKIVGTDPKIVENALINLLDNQDEYSSMSQGYSPYGDGQASSRIVDAFAFLFGYSNQRQFIDFAFQKKC